MEATLERKAALFLTVTAIGVGVATPYAPKVIYGLTALDGLITVIALRKMDIYESSSAPVVPMILFTAGLLGLNSVWGFVHLKELHLALKLRDFAAISSHAYLSYLSFVMMNAIVRHGLNWSVFSSRQTRYGEEVRRALSQVAKPFGIRGETIDFLSYTPQELEQGMGRLEYLYYSCQTHYIGDLKKRLPCWSKAEIECMLELEELPEQVTKTLQEYIEQLEKNEGKEPLRPLELPKASIWLRGVDLAPKVVGQAFLLVSMVAYTLRSAPHSPKWHMACGLIGLWLSWKGRSYVAANKKLYQAQWFMQVHERDDRRAFLAGVVASSIFSTLKPDDWLSSYLPTFLSKKLSFMEKACPFFPLAFGYQVGQMISRMIKISDKEVAAASIDALLKQLEEGKRASKLPKESKSASG